MEIGLHTRTHTKNHQRNFEITDRVSMDSNAGNKKRKRCGAQQHPWHIAVGTSSLHIFRVPNGGYTAAVPYLIKGISVA